jgi:hypothetical protein
MYALAMESMRSAGMTLPANAVRGVVADPVVGSKIGVDNSEKSPVRIFTVGTVTTVGTPCFRRYPS